MGIIGEVVEEFIIGEVVIGAELITGLIEEAVDGGLITELLVIFAVELLDILLTVVLDDSKLPNKSIEEDDAKF